jgi:hypothetical protein
VIQENVVDTAGRAERQGAPRQERSLVSDPDAHAAPPMPIGKLRRSLKLPMAETELARLVSFAIGPVWTEASVSKHG